MHLTHPQNVLKKREKVNMTDDLVKRLRCYADIDDAVYNPWVYGEAADRIEHLENRCANLLVGNGILNIHIEKLEAALDDMAHYVSRADWHYLKDQTRQALEGKDD